MHPVSRLLIVVVSLLAACANVPGESTTRSSVVTLNRIALNRIALNRIALNRLPLSRLATSRLSNNQLSANMDSAGKLLASDDGLEIFSLIVNCALPPGVTLVANVDGNDIEFPGEMGLAIGWISQPLDADGQGWVSACMFARSNARDVSLVISLRGPNPALATDAGERAFFSVEEGAFFGNFFAPIDQPIPWYACRGAGQAQGEFGELIDRDCTEPDPTQPGLTQCGLNYAGDCGTFAVAHACDKFSGGYSQCHTSAGKAGDTVFQQVITSYVTP